MKDNQSKIIPTAYLVSVWIFLCVVFVNINIAHAQSASAGSRSGFASPVETYNTNSIYNQRRVLPFVRDEEYLRRDDRNLGIGLEERLDQNLFYGWQFVPHITLDEIYTDNVRLAPSGFEDDDFITVVTPGISIRNLTNRFSWALDYSLQNIFYADNSDEDVSLHLLNIDTLSELINDHLFLNFKLDHSPRNRSNIGSVAFDNFSITGDRTDVATYSVNPYWLQRIGNYAELEIGFNRNEVISGSRVNSSSAQGYNVNLLSGPYFTRLLWDIAYEEDKIDYEDAGRDITFRTIRGQARYLLTRQFALIGALGYDKNEFESLENDISGVLWNVGAAWTPSRRTQVEGTIGERFFGTDIAMNVTHRTRNTRWSFSYTQTPTTTRAFLFEQQVFNLFDQFGEPVINPNTGEQATLLVDIPQQTPEVIIRERFSAAVQYVLRRNIFNLNAYIEDRDYQISSDSEEVSGVNGSWIWEIGPKTRSVLSLARYQNDLRTGFTDEYIVAQYELIRLLGTSLEASIGARYLNRDSDFGGREYEENRIFLKLYKTF